MTETATTEATLARIEANMANGFAELRRVIGEESEDGKGGTGLTGRIVRTEQRVASVYDLKRAGVGFLFACSLLGTVIWFGFKALVAGALSGAKGS